MDDLMDKNFAGTAGPAIDTAFSHFMESNKVLIEQTSGLYEIPPEAFTIILRIAFVNGALSGAGIIHQMLQRIQERRNAAK